MLGKTRRAFLMVLALSLVFTGVAYAQGETPEARIRVAGTITAVDPSAESRRAKLRLLRYIRNALHQSGRLD